MELLGMKTTEMQSAGVEPAGMESVGMEPASMMHAVSWASRPARRGLSATQYILLDESRKLADRRTAGARSSAVMLSPWAVDKSTPIAGRLVLALPWQWMPWRRARQVTQSSSLRRKAERLITPVTTHMMLSQVLCGAHAR